MADLDFLLSIRDDIKYVLEHRNSIDNFNILEKIIEDINFILDENGEDISF